MRICSQREPQVLDFQTQQHKLLPLLATAYAYNFAGLALIDMVNEIMLEVKGGNYRRLIEVSDFLDFWAGSTWAGNLFVAAI